MLQPIAAWAKLEQALSEVALAKSCIADNRGPDKELAREAYEACLGEVLLPAVMEALEGLDNQQLLSIAKQVHKKLEGK